MPPSGEVHLDTRTPMGAVLVEGGGTFRVWAPRAFDVYLLTGPAAEESRSRGWRPSAATRMRELGDGTWGSYVAGVAEATPYRFYVVGEDGGGFKRDPWARELGIDPPYPTCDCLVRDPATYPWHDDGFRPPPFNDLTIYQLHVGVFWGVDAQGNDTRESVANFLDTALRIPYLRDLGVTAIQLLPIQEFPHDNSLGYNNLDFFSPEMAYQVDDPVLLDWYLTVINEMLWARGAAPLTRAQLAPGPNQLKALVDLLHVNGLAVIFDLVYNHAGGDFDDESMYFLDRKRRGNQNDSLYFSDREWAGGLSFQYWTAPVEGMLIQNAKFFLSEYHIDGIRYDEVSVIDNHGGWRFCQDLSSTVRYHKPEAIQIAEYWNDRRELAVLPPATGLGFDAALGDGLREALRGSVGAAGVGRDAHVDLQTVRDRLYPPWGFADAWRAVNCIENHDVVYSGREPRVARLADGTNARSWYARSRSRWATSILLTAPGIPMLFMGEEILEDKNWDDNPRQHPNTLIWWDGLGHDAAMRDFLSFTRAVLHLRRNTPALRGPRVNGYHVNNDARVLAFHRWLDWSGGDVVVVGTLSEYSLFGYELGLPQAGPWREMFNSDSFESDPAHVTTGNGGQVFADGGPLHGMPASGSLTIPANGVIVLAR